MKRHEASRNAKEFLQVSKAKAERVAIRGEKFCLLIVLVSVFIVICASPSFHFNASNCLHRQISYAEMRFTRPESAFLGVRLPLHNTIRFLQRASILLLFLAFFILRQSIVKRNWSGVDSRKICLNNSAKIVEFAWRERLGRQLEEVEERKTNWSMEK